MERKLRFSGRRVAVDRAVTTRKTNAITWRGNLWTLQGRPPPSPDPCKCGLTIQDQSGFPVRDAQTLMAQAMATRSTNINRNGPLERLLATPLVVRTQIARLLP